MLSNTFSISIQEIVLLITVGAATYSIGHIMSKKQDKTACEQNLKGLYSTINTLEKALTDLSVLLKEVGVKLDTGLQSLQRQIDDIKKSLDLSNKMDIILRRNEDVKNKS